MIHPDVIAMARAGEPERYIAATVSPAHARPALVALAAFAADLRRIPTVVKEPMMGEVRLQWWRDTIETFDAETSTGHPIADALGDAVRRHALPPLSLIAMTEARAFDLYDDQMPDETALAGYLAKTEAIPFSLAQHILGAATPSIDTITRAGEMFGKTRLLAELPHALSRGRLPLPSEMLKKSGVEPDELLRGQTSQPFATLLTRTCADIATAHAAVRNSLRSAPHETRLALLPLACIPAYLNAIQKSGRDPLRTPAEISPLARVWRIGRARWLGL